MLGSIKKKLNNVIQDGFVISESIRQRVTTPSTPTFEESNISTSTRSSIGAAGIPTGIDVTAGCNMLAKYEDDWRRVRLGSEENAQRAIQIATQIEKVEKTAKEQQLDMTDLITCLASIPALVLKLQAGMDTLQKISTQSKEIEQELEKLQILLEECEFQELMLGKQFELSRYKQKKINDLEQFRQGVAAKHQTKLQQHEEHFRQIQRERAAVFDDAFQCDMAEYKLKGSISKISQEPINKLFLEEVVLEDTETENTLEEFLND